MTITSRPYRDASDFLHLTELLSEAALAAPQSGYLHPGDLVWWVQQNSEFTPMNAIQVFEDEAGHLQGSVFSDPLEWAAVQARPGTSDVVLDEMVDHALQKAQGKALIAWTYEGDLSSSGD